MNKYSIKIVSNNLKTRRAFTLIELIVYMGLLAILLIVLTDLFVAILEVRIKSQSISYVEQDGRYILARLNYALHSPMNLIRQPANLGETDSTLDYAYQFIIHQYYLDGSGNLIYNLPAFGQTANLNSSETTVSNLSFTKLGNPGGKETIKIQFTVTSKTQGASGSETKTFTTTVGRR